MSQCSGGKQKPRFIEAFIATLISLGILPSFLGPPPQPIVEAKPVYQEKQPVKKIETAQPNKASGVLVGNVGDILDRISMCESHQNPRAVSADGRHRGAWQFDLATYHSNGGTGDPIEDSYAEQKRVAANLYARRGGSPWPVCSRR